MPSPALQHTTTWSSDKEGATYERGRPDYPAEATQVLAERLGLGPDRLDTTIHLGVRRQPDRP